MKKIRILLTGCAAAAVLASVTFFGHAKDPAPAAADAQKQLASSRNVDLAKQLNEAFIEVADKVSPAVVVIQVTQKAGAAVTMDDEENPFDLLPPDVRRFFGGDPRNGGGQNRRGASPRRPPVVQGQGSGVVISDDGYILTNNHVVEGAETIKVRFRDSRVFTAEVKGRDPQSDLAVIKINAKNLVTAKLGDSAAARVGEFVIAIGAPFQLDYSVTIGHLSAKGRSVIFDPNLDQDFLQTDASINPGNSGGPLVNLYGEVIGINAMIRGMNTGIGFAIPSNLAKQVIPHLMKEGHFTRSRIGVEIRGLREDQEYKEFVPNLEDGVVIHGITANGPAAKSDLKVRDVVVAVDGKPVKSARELKEEVAYKKPGETVTLDVVRGDKKLKIKVKTEAFAEEETTLSSRKTPGNEADTANFGLSVRPLTKDLAEQYGVEATSGVIVTGVDRNSPAADKLLQPGDVIIEVDGKPVKDTKQFRDALKKSDPKRGALVSLLSKGSSRFVVLKEGS
jgi:serine protease Do